MVEDGRRERERRMERERGRRLKEREREREEWGRFFSSSLVCLFGMKLVMKKKFV